MANWLIDKIDSFLEKEYDTLIPGYSRGLVNTLERNVSYFCNGTSETILLRIESEPSENTTDGFVEIAPNEHHTRVRYNDTDYATVKTMTGRVIWKNQPIYKNQSFIAT